MKAKNIFILVSGILSGVVAGCDDNIDPVIEELDLARVFSPTELEANIRTNTTIELNWNVKEDVDHYVVEFSEDSLEFNTIIRTVEVSPENVPVQEKFFGDTRYSARVKAVSSTGKEDSKWSAVTIRTNPENILQSVANEDVAIDGVFLQWPAGEHATRFVFMPGNIEYNITASDVTNGEATVTGLDYYTNYTVTMYAGNSQRGKTTFKTLMDPACATCIMLNPGDNINTAIAGAAEGSIIILSAGDYTEQGAIDIPRSVTIRAEVYYEMPVVYGQLTSATAVTLLEVNDIHFRGDTASPMGVFFNALTGTNLTTFNILDCEISHYTNGIIYNNTASTFGTIKVTNTMAHTIVGSGGDGFDIRGGVITALNVQNSTFANGFRNFLRMQVNCAVVFKNNTFYRVSNYESSNNNGLFRLNKAVGGSLEVSSCLFVETGLQNPLSPQEGNFCRQDSYMVENPVYSNNNIFNCHNLLAGLYTTAAQVSATELNPAFEDAANNDFTVTNQAVLDKKIGDSRWLK